MSSVLIATLGAEPQVIPLATALLLARAPLAAVVVLHTAAHLPPIAASLPAVQATFAAQHGWPPLQLDALPLDDALTPDDMAMVGMSVAQLVLGPDDHVWYLHSDDDLRHSGRTLPSAGDRVTLVPIPLPRLAVAPPAFTGALQAPTRAGALAALDARRGLKREFLRRELAGFAKKVRRELP